MRYFSPPTLKKQGTDDPVWGRYQTYYGVSVLWTGSQFADRPNPMHEELAPLQDGVTYFLGGREYLVTDEVAATLAASGYETQDGPPDPNPDPPDDTFPGFGEGPYGEGGYGS